MKTLSPSPIFSQKEATALTGQGETLLVTVGEEVIRSSTSIGVVHSGYYRQVIPMVSLLGP